MVGVYTEISGVCCIDGVLASGVWGGLLDGLLEEEPPTTSLCNNKTYHNNINLFICTH